MKEPDLAISMYKEQRRYDDMFRLVAAYHPELVNETHLFLAKSLEAEGLFKDAESHYVQASDWKTAIQMYCTNSLFEEAYRVFGFLKSLQVFWSSLF